MRITNNMSSAHVLHDLNSVAERLSDTQRRMSTGRQITRPSDDPNGTSRALDLRSSIEGMQQFQRNVNEATGWLNTTDTALARIGDAVHRARELIVGAATDTATPNAREAAALEIEALIEAVKQEAGAQYAGRYVFSGTETSTKPYSPGAAGDAYAGDAALIAREIGPGVSVTVNTIGSDLLGSGQAAGDARLLDTLRDAVDHLRGGTPADADALRNGDLQRIDANFDVLNRARAAVGATTNRLDTAGRRLAELEETATSLLSQTEDADMAKTLVDFSMQQSVYQSALKSGATLVQNSLLDFLR